MADKKLRFETFKRDGFKCQYCGRTPPEVILEADHIIPKSQNGKDEIDNMITACFDCNRGKGKDSLDIIPQPLSDRFQQMQEKREQLKAYTEYLQEVENDIYSQTKYLNSHFGKYYLGYSFSERFNNSSIKIFLNHLPYSKIADAISLAAARFPSPEQREYAIKYFCGICWNWIKHPEMRDW